MNSKKRKRSHVIHSLLEEIRKDTTRETWNILTTDLVKWLDRIGNITSNIQTSVEDISMKNLTSSLRCINDLAMDIIRKCSTVNDFWVLALPQLSYGENHSQTLLSDLNSHVVDLRSRGGDYLDNMMIISQ